MEQYPRKGGPHQILEVHGLSFPNPDPHCEEGQVCIFGQVKRTNIDLIKLDERIDLWRSRSLHLTVSTRTSDTYQRTLDIT